MDDDAIREQIREVVLKLKSAEGTQREVNRRLGKLQELARDDEITNFMYYPSRYGLGDVLTTDQIVDKAMELRNQKPKFLLGHD